MMSRSYLAIAVPYPTIYLSRRSACTSVAPTEEGLAPAYNLIGKGSPRRRVRRSSRHFALRAIYELPQLDLQVAERHAVIPLAAHVLSKRSAEYHERLEGAIGRLSERSLEIVR